MSLLQVTVVSVPVTDQQRAKDFYVDALGFELLGDEALDNGRRWIRVGLPGTPTQLSLISWFDEMPAGSLHGLVIECDEIDGVCARLQALGVEFEEPLAQQPWAYEAIVRDPDGNTLVIQQPGGQTPTNLEGAAAQ